MEILIAIDELDDLVHGAPTVPLTDQARLDDGTLPDAAGRLRAAAEQLFGPLHAQTGPMGELFSAIDDLEAMVAGAPPVPLLPQVRVDRVRVYDLLDRMRAAVPLAAPVAW